MHDELMALAGRLAAAGEQAALPCPDPVNAAMIRNWTQALGDAGTWDDVAPPAMIQVWSMPGLVRRPDQKGVADDPLRLLDEAGYTGIVATNCDQTYDRYVKVGERLRTRMRFGGVTGPKKTAMGEGYFVTWYQSWYGESDERVAEMLFRVLKFKPNKKQQPPAKGGKYPLQPAIGRDTAFFWDGVNAGELRIQRCADCGALRHPPGPMCPKCHSPNRDHVVASGRGEVHSYVVHHHPPVPGRTPPYVVAVVELEEGVRIVGNVNGCAPDDVKVGMPVRLVFERMDDELVLPQWIPADAPPPEEPAAEPVAEASAGADGLRIELTPTFIISTAIATRDFMPVHHDPAVARAQGSKDIFVNILTSVGLVQRYALETVPDGELESIEVRLGAPAYAGDVLTLTGDRADDRTLRVRGAVSLGDHLTATVRFRGNG
ncbi:OB-fold domain-containing protein [Actinomadura opuntiae]|uniref:OB-fold domain-containing protein n=1 Tax=Actinomadura sp. OS1-43 TaxID=604315 RepID=UPI00255B07CA|nr:OB-fold domain-containing protein [Actinomadura sp. OS1-43]MDL4821312.1 OB-fold domain-containing protein [Actinomadura sp. OS1-43]